MRFNIFPLTWQNARKGEFCFVHTFQKTKQNQLKLLSSTYFCIPFYFISRIGEGVMGKLADIASFAVKKTGIFHNTQTKQISGSTMPTGSKIVVLHI